MNVFEKIKDVFIKIKEWFSVERNREVFAIGAFIILSPILAFLTGTKLSDYGFQNIFHGLPQFALMTSAIVFSIVMMARDINPGVKINKDFFTELLKYWGWGGLQQIALISCYFIFQNVLGPLGIHWWWNVVFAGSVFAMFHKPNIVLFYTTLSLGMVNLLLFHDNGNIYALAILHGTAGTFLGHFLPRVLLANFSIGSIFRDEQRELNDKFK